MWGILGNICTKISDDTIYDFHTYYDTSGNPILTLEDIGEISEFSDGLAKIANKTPEKNGYYYIDKSGNAILGNKK